MPFSARIRALRAHNVRRDRAGTLESFRSKLMNYELAQSHGVQIPEILGAWPSIDDVEFSALPERFVLKSDGGHSGNGVLLLERQSEGLYRLVGEERELGESEVRRYFRQKYAAGQARGVLFAEAFLSTPADEHGSEIPEDVKVYAAYGSVLQVLLRSVTRLRDTEAATWKYVDADGVDLGEQVRGRRVESGIPLPRAWNELIDAARHLSYAAGTPFLRVDLFSTTRGVVLGELTPSPGGAQKYAPGHDEKMGQGWAEAERRLIADTTGSRPRGIIYGSVADRRLFPAECAPSTEKDELQRRYDVGCPYCDGI